MATILDDVLDGTARWIVAHGDNTDLLPFIPDESIDAVVSDPPAGISFRQAMWDRPGVLGISGGKAMPATTASRNPSCRTCGAHKRNGKKRACTCAVPDWNDTEKRIEDREAFIASLTGAFREALRVLKPGGYALVWALPRTSGWTRHALENAGFEIREIFDHLFGQGYPKSFNVSKGIDNAAGVEREDDAVAVTDDAKRWDGFGTALKPAHEDWIVARKPLIGTVVENVRRHGTGALNIDAARVFTDWSERSESWKRSGHSAKPDADKIAAPPGDGIICHPKGRWPPNVLLSHAPCCRRVGERTVRGSGFSAGFVGDVETSVALGDKRAMIRPESVYASPDGTEVVEAWECLAACECGLTQRFAAGGDPPRCDCGEAMFWTCPVAELDRQSGPAVGSNGRRAEQPVFLGYGGRSRGATLAAVEKSMGGASRFFPTFGYYAKATAADKNDGLEEKNSHATVKSKGLMRYLCRLATPPNGVVLDLYAGSGSTGVAAIAEGLRFIGIEREAKHAAEARSRCARAELDLAEERTGQVKLFAPAVPTTAAPKVSAPPPQIDLFAPRSGS